MARTSAPAGRLLNAAAPSGSTTRTEVMMGTFVTVQVVHRGPERDAQGRTRDAAIDSAFEWIAEVERRCSRFDPASEVRQVSERAGQPVAVSPMLYAAVEFALAVAAETGGAFDPTIGADMEQRGFDTNYRTRTSTATSLAGGAASYRDVRLDPAARTITCERPLLLDLGAVAKGLAVDMAARELAGFGHYAIDAGGDLYVAGQSPSGAAWSIGIRHPRDDGEFAQVLQVSDVAVCTSGDYERPGGNAGHHIVDARTRTTAGRAVSATVIAPTTVLADALATAAFVLGAPDGVALLERHGVEGIIVAPDLASHATRGFDRHA